MRALFPRVRKLTVKDAGHWVHTDQPEITVTALRSLLAQPIVEGP
jgi:pimeloyl-ACP methyl ester carboxylesterase